MSEKKRRKPRLPARLLILWSADEQQRLIDTLERLHSVVADLVIWSESEKQRRSAAATKANATRKANAQAAATESMAETEQDEMARVLSEIERGGQ